MKDKKKSRLYNIVNRITADFFGKEFDEEEKKIIQKMKEISGYKFFEVKYRWFLEKVYKYTENTTLQEIEADLAFCSEKANTIAEKYPEMMGYLMEAYQRRREEEHKEIRNKEVGSLFVWIKGCYEWQLGKFEAIVIQENMYIEKGENIEFSGRDIRIEADIICRGELIFENCKIHFGSEERKGRILLETEANLFMDGCFISRDIQEEDESIHTLIQMKEENTLEITDSIMLNSSHMIAGQQVKKLLILHSEISGKVDSFLKAAMAEEGCFRMEECRISSMKLRSFIQIEDSGSYASVQRIVGCKITFDNKGVHCEQKLKNYCPEEKMQLPEYYEIDMLRGKVLDTCIVGDGRELQGIRVAEFRGCTIYRAGIFQSGKYMHRNVFFQCNILPMNQIISERNRFFFCKIGNLYVENLHDCQFYDARGLRLKTRIMSNCIFKKGIDMLILATEYMGGCEYLDLVKLEVKER